MMNFKSLLLSQITYLNTEPEVYELAARLMTLSDDFTEEECKEAIEEAIRIITINMGESFVVKSDLKFVPWFENYYKELGLTRWDRYSSYLLNHKEFPISVIQNMQGSLYKIIDLAGNPNDENFSRKGLIVGDVQSGKTSNYVGLMNLAMDVGYKIIIVLTGTTNTLREQTQIRIEEGLGQDKLGKGVCEVKDRDYSRLRNPVYLTSRENDFSISSVKNFQASVEQIKSSVVIVTKKNTTALKNIYNWLISYSKKKNNNKIDFSLMLIDDEADFASVNTSKEDESPTMINRRIREILNLFTKNSYVGFTATPYANIFIEPENEDLMFGQDLFPKDYIYVLGESEEYIGATKIFQIDDEYEKYQNKVQIISENIEHIYLPLVHRKETLYETLSDSLKHAINIFFIANTIRDIRGQSNTHRTMLLNMSRFINLHEQIKYAVWEYVEILKQNIRLFSKMPIEEALKNPVIKDIENSFLIEYHNKLEFEIRFTEIIKNINDAVYKIRVIVVNSNSKELDYHSFQEEGDRVIVIGGLALSRGLTLEGLMVSYFYRNSSMYDSLLQMGRWFGYRSGYADLCRIYMTNKVKSDFEFIARATKELKEDLKINSQRGLTPKQFGIKVRSGHDGLIITARNKMRSSREIIARANFSKDIIETTVFSIDREKFNERNDTLIKDFVARNKNSLSTKMHPNYNSIGLKNIDKSEILWFLSQYVSVDMASRFDSKLIIDWLDANKLDQLENWDVAFPTGSSDDINFDYGYGIFGKAHIRTVYNHNSRNDLYHLTRSRLGSPTDGMFGLSNYDVELVKQNHKEISKAKTISQKEYFSLEINRNPILVIYSILPRVEEEYITDYSIPLISLGVPELEINRTQYIEYKVNQMYLDLEYIEIEEE